MKHNFLKMENIGKLLIIKNVLENFLKVKNYLLSRIFFIKGANSRQVLKPVKQLTFTFFKR